MQKILIHDNWVEIPAGEFLTGLSEAQREAIVERLLAQVGFPERPGPERKLLRAASIKLRQHPRIWLDPEERESFRLSDQVPSRMFMIEERLSATPPQKTVRLDRFYIARYPITERQYALFTTGTPATHLPDALEEAEIRVVEINGKKKQTSGRWVAAVRSDEALKLCRGLGARLPTSPEWEKAARGIDGRLYPWGNEWNSHAGFFSYDQEFVGPGIDQGRSVTGYPEGVSPFGLWSMAGTLPELVTVDDARPILTKQVEWGNKRILVDIKGVHAKESSAELAWFDHILALPGYGFWVSLRPVLDKWPKTQWTGHTTGKQR
jgi:formylglycine-generating enzyme required for sulfatase activity